MSDRNKNKGKAQSLDNDQKFLKKIGNHIKELRINAGHTSAESFAWNHGFGRTQYTNWEQGRNITLLSLRRLTIAFNLTLQEFFAGIE